jgi:hypothetical protein
MPRRGHHEISALLPTLLLGDGWLLCFESWAIITKNFIFGRWRRRKDVRFLVTFVGGFHGCAAESSPRRQRLSPLKERLEVEISDAKAKITWSIVFGLRAFSASVAQLHLESYYYISLAMSLVRRDRMSRSVWKLVE